MIDPSRGKKPFFSGFKRVAVLMASSAALLACSDEVTGPSDLAGRWRLQSMEVTGASRFEPDDPGRFTVEFRADGGIGVVADCNQCGGSYSLGGGTLTVPPLVCTLVACPTPHGTQFASLIDGTSSVESDGDELEIESSEGKVVLAR